MNRRLTLLACLAATAVEAQVKTPNEIRYPALADFRIARPETFKLANGMEIFLLPDRELPLIDVLVRVRTGSAWEPAAQTGLADLFGNLLREGGTTQRSGDRVDDFLAERAARIETSVGADFGSARMNCLAQDFDDVLALLHEILRYPKFAEDKIEVARTRARAGIARRNDSIAAIATREFRRLIYGEASGLSRLTEHTTLDAIDRDSLIAWHRRDYQPNNMFIGVVGDFEPGEMRKKIERQFGSWPAGPPVKVVEPAYQREPRPGIWFIEKEGVTQAYVRMGHLGMKIDHPDYFAVQVMNEIFGGGFSARLFSNVRSKKGLAYSVSGGVGASNAYPGLFTVALSTKSSTMSQSVDALREEVAGLLARPPSEAELNRAKESILNSFVFNFDSSREVLEQQFTYAYYGLPADFLEKYRAQIERVTLGDVIRVSKAWVHPDRLTLLVVGQATDFDRPVESLGTVKRIDITIPQPKPRVPAATN